jgi:hypothetical protein
MVMSGKGATGLMVSVPVPAGMLAGNHPSAEAVIPNGGKYAADVIILERHAGAGGAL